ncbi:hypothetical protein ASZ90_010554 [hydrocarbon metagenome]|uniref:Uncharacterized protein n=1 Tax=hydrocarbon metagenome TaxID=938273 RepID=A0A0W8FFR4_9ZZZZ
MQRIVAGIFMGGDPLSSNPLRGLEVGNRAREQNVPDRGCLHLSVPGR